MEIIKEPKRFGQGILQKFNYDNEGKKITSLCFSIIETTNKLTLEEMRELCKLVINLSKEYPYEEIIKKLKDL